jgi:5-methylcytosine-specific restriction endonuclease McrA
VPVFRFFLVDELARCVVCGSTTNLVADHVVTLSAGGPNELSNYQVLCRTCNTRQYSQTPAFSKGRAVAGELEAQREVELVEKNA